MMKLLLLGRDAASSWKLNDMLLGNSDLTLHVTVALTIEAAKLLVCEAEPPFDMLLIDQRLGAESDGIDIMQRLRLLSPGTEAIILVNPGDPDGSLRAYESGAYRYLPKMADVRELIYVLQPFYWLRVFTEISEDSQQAVSVQAVELIVVQGGCALGFERARLWRVSEDREWLILACHKGNKGLDDQDGFRVPISKSKYTQDALNTRDPCFFHGNDQGLGYLDSALAKHGYAPPVGEWVHMSLWIGEQCWGVLALDNASNPRQLRPAQRHLLRLFGRQVSAARERARLHEIEQRAIKGAEILNQIGERIATGAALYDLDKLLREVRLQIGKLVDVRNFTVVLLDEDDSLLNFRLHVVDNEFRSREPRPRATSLVGHLISVNQTLFLPNGCEEYRKKHAIPVNDKVSRSYLGVPLCVEDRAMGAIVLQSYDESGLYSEEDCRLVKMVVSKIAGAIQAAYSRMQETDNSRRLLVLQHASKELMQLAVEHEDLLWHATLTVATAGYALGFNRALLLFVEGNGNRLCGHSGIGHLNRNQAERHWKKDLRTGLDFETYLERLRAQRWPATPVDAVIRKWSLDITEDQGALARALRTRARVIVAAHEVAEQLPLAFIERLGRADYAVLPLRVGDRLVGLVIVDNIHTKEPLRKPQLDQLEILLDQAALIKENLRQRLARDKLIELNNVVLADTGNRALGDILKQICEAAQTVTGADSVLIYPIKPNVSPYEYDIDNVGHVGLQGPLIIRDKPREKGISLHILENETLLIPDVTQALSYFPRGVAEHPFVKREGIRAFIGAAVRDPATNEPVGVLYMNYRSARSLTEHDRSQAASFATLAAVVVRNASEKQRELNILRKVLEAALSPDIDEQELVRCLLNATRQLLHQDQTSVDLLLITSGSSYRSGDEERSLHRQYHLQSENELTIDAEADLDCGITGEALRTGKTLCNTFYVDKNTGVRSKMAVPIKRDGKVIGVFNAESPDTNAFNIIHQTAIEHLAAAASLALNNLQRRDELSKERDRLQAAMQITEAVGATLGLDETLLNILSTLHKLFPHATPCIMLYDETEHTLVFTHASQKFYQIDNSIYQKLSRVGVDGQSIASAVARASLKSRETEEAVIGDVDSDPSYLKLKDETRSELCVSLVSEGNLRGVLLLESWRPNAFGKDDVAVIHHVADQVNIALDRSYQSRQARRHSTLAALMAWAAGIAHDANHELQYIGNRIAWLREDTILTDLSQQHADEIETSLGRMFETFQEADPRQAQAQDTIVLGPWLQQQVETFIPQGLDVHVQYALNDNDVEIHTYPAFLKRVLHHLIRNAVKAMQRVGTVTIRTQQLEQFVEIQVEDTGPGVPDSLRQNLIDRQLIFEEPVINSENGGGLGLLLVSLDIERLGGTIRLLPREQGRGAIFAFKLPLNRREQLNGHQSAK